MEDPQVPNKQRPPRWAIYVVGTVAASSVSIAAMLISTSSHNSGTPNVLLEQVSSHKFVMYYPTKLPKGYRFEKSDLRSNPELIIYGFSYEKDKKLLVNIQPKPKSVQFDDFYTRILKNKADVFTPEGSAAIGTASGQTIASLVTDSSWVILTTNDSIDGQDLTQIVSSLKPVR